MEEKIKKWAKCIHCFKELKQKTKDHVFPKSWYTTNTPPWVQRWTVPSCSECNGKFGKIEKALFPRLALCVDPQKYEAAGITKKVLKSFGIGDRNLSPREKKIRETFLKEIMNEAKPYSENMKPFPGLGPHQGFPFQMQIAIPLPQKLLIPVLEKIFRGLEYKIGKRYIQAPYYLKIYHVFEEPKEVKKLLNFSVTISFGPGFRVERVVPANRTEPVFYKTIIWGTLISYASVDLK